MDLFRKLASLLIAISIAAFALPASAQTKIFSLKMSYSSTSGSYRALYTNETPNGNSTINSIILTAPPNTTFQKPAAGTTYMSATQLNTSVTGWDTNQLSVSNIPGVKAGGNTWWIDVKLNQTPPTCSTWAGQAFAGNAFSQPFALQTDLSVLTVAGPSPGCTTATVNMSPTQLTQNTTGAPMTATLATNGVGLGSFTLQAPSSVLTVKTVALPNGSSGSASVDANGLITVKNVGPVTSLTLSLTVDVKATCTSSTGNSWTPMIYTDGGATGTQIPLNSTGSSLTTDVTAVACSISIKAPTSAALGSSFGVDVTLTGGSGSSNVSITSSNCTLDPSSVTGSITGGSGTVGGIKITGTSSNSDTCSLTATANDYSPQATTTITGLKVYAGTLNCGDTLAMTGTNPLNLPDTAPGWASGVRGSVNSKGDPCVLVNYTVANTITTNNTIGLTWDTGTQPNAVFSMSANFKPEDIDSATGWPVLTGTSPRVRPKTGWKYNGTTPVYIDGLTCAAPAVPVVYGKLASAASAGSTSISVAVGSGVTVPPAPFVVTVDSERLAVASATTGSTQTWTLASATQISHASDAPVAAKYPGLPEVYGTVGSISSTTLVLTGRLRDLPPAQFPIQVGAERMLVTAVSTDQLTLTVTRGDGGTPTAGTTAGMKVVSTPLPLIPTSVINATNTAYYTAGKPAQMCISAYGWVPAGMNATGNLKAMRFVEWYDLGDGWMSMD